jgi:hypothetical protein
MISARKKEEGRVFFFDIRRGQFVIPFKILITIKIEFIKNIPILALT